MISKKDAALSMRGLIQKINITSGEDTVENKDEIRSARMPSTAPDKKVAEKKVAVKKKVVVKKKAPVKKKNVGKKSKAKGSNFERKICKELSSWVSKGQSDSLFWRSAMSGGRATIGIQQQGGGNIRKEQLGDVSSISKLGEVLVREFVIELKHVKDINVEPGILYGTKAGLVTYWDKLLSECIASGKQPMLIGRSNNRPVLLITSLSVGSDIQSGIDAKANKNKRAKKKFAELKTKAVKMWAPNLGLCVLIFDEVVQALSFDEFMTALHIPKIKRVRIVPKAQRGKK